MLYAAPAISKRITQVNTGERECVLSSEAGKIRIVPLYDNCVRITYTEREQFSSWEKPGILPVQDGVLWSVQETQTVIILKLGELELHVMRETGAISYYRIGEDYRISENNRIGEDCRIDEDRKAELLFKESARNPREVEEFTSFQLAEDQEVKVEKVQTVDGVKDIVREAARTASESLYHTRLYLELSEGEGIYGLGQQEEGNLNLRGKTVYIHQANRKIAMPFMVSSRGYGILMNTYSPMIFNDNGVSTYFYTEADVEQDYYVMCGSNMNAVVAQYRRLTGKAAMLPKWAFGYMQSQERYETAEEILKVADTYREKELGLDCIVLDWCSWEENQWGQKSFDPKRFPDPKQMVDSLHEKKVHFMISIWPNMAQCTKDYKQMKEIKGLLPASDIYNAYMQEARELYWRQVRDNLFCHGVDAWWCDSSEPLTIEWTHKNRMEPGSLFAEYSREMSNHMPAKLTNAFSFYHAKTLYEGQRGENSEKRVCNLTRSAYTGQQRYGTILWSGDTDASWKTLEKQIPEGLNLVSSGLPYWTVDIGAFFVKKSNFWYWDGEYQAAADDPAYRELYTRWFQWAVFLPVFRAHGTDCRREMWAFEHENEPFYPAMVKASQMRYRLMPLIYSQAGKVWLEDAMFIKPVVFDYPQDPRTLDLKNEYLFCENLLVCPVTEPMYYDAKGRILEKEKKHRVYLPEGNGWYDINDNHFYEGGTEIEVSAEIDRLPCFVKEGSILPMAEVSQYVVEREEITWVVYSGKDCSYTLYRDAGDGYGYEKGEYTLETVVWSEKEQCLKLETGEIIKNVDIRK